MRHINSCRIRASAIKLLVSYVLHAVRPLQSSHVTECAAVLFEVTTLHIEPLAYNLLREMNPQEKLVFFIVGWGSTMIRGLPSPPYV